MHLIFVWYKNFKFYLSLVIFLLFCFVARQALVSKNKQTILDLWIQIYPISLICYDCIFFLFYNLLVLLQTLQISNATFILSDSEEIHFLFLFFRGIQTQLNFYLSLSQRTVFKRFYSFLIIHFQEALSLFWYD